MDKISFERSDTLGVHSKSSAFSFTAIVIHFNDGVCECVLSDIGVTRVMMLILLINHVHKIENHILAHKPSQRN